MNSDFATIRQNLNELQRELSRRAFFKTVARGVGLGVTLDQFGAKLFGEDKPTKDDRPVPFQVYSAIGNIVIPVDQDPGWATFEPGISDYGLGVFAAQVMLGGNQRAFGGLLAALVAMNEIPPLIDYGSTFLKMPLPSQQQYLADILSNAFENDGVQDLLLVPGSLGLFTTKAVFFSNYPRHLANPNAEFQVLPPFPIKTGWDIMGFRGPISEAEEKALRERYFDALIFPGVDPNNPYI